jgi:uncharacterized protein
MSRGRQITAAIAAIALVFAGALAAFVFSGGGDASPRTVQAQEYYDNRGISVQGEGQVSVTPDVANIVLGVQVEGSDLGELRSNADSRMSDVIDALQEIGIAEEDIRTVTYDIWVQEQPRDPRPILEEPVRDEEVEVDEEEEVTDEDAVTEEDDDVTDDEDVTDEEEVSDDTEVTDEVTTEEADEGLDTDPGAQTYVLVQLVQVRIIDIDQVGEVIDTALDSGANRVGSISFDVEDRQGAVEEARAAAVEQARQKADHLAELTGVSVGIPLKIEESSPYWPAFAEEFAMEDAAVAAEEAMARVEPGQQVITVNVYITYDIE